MWMLVCISWGKKKVGYLFYNYAMEITNKLYFQPPDCVHCLKMPENGKEKTIGSCRHRFWCTVWKKKQPLIKIISEGEVKQNQCN